MASKLSKIKGRKKDGDPSSSDFGRPSENIPASSPVIITSGETTMSGADAPPPRDEVQIMSEEFPENTPVIISSGEESLSSGPNVSQSRDEIQEIFEEYAGTIENLFQESRKQYLMNISELFQTFGQKIEDMVKLEGEQRLKLYQDYYSEFSSWNKILMVDARKYKKQVEKAADILQEQQKLSEKLQLTQRKRMEEIAEICEKYLKSLEDLLDNQENVIVDELKNIMASLEENLDSETEKSAADQNSLLDLMLS